MPPFLPSADQVAFYRREGYIVVRTEEHNLVDPVDLQIWTNEILHWPREKGKWMPYDEINTRGERKIMRTEKIIDYHPKFRDLLCGEGTLALLKALTGKDVLLFKDKINYKLPGAKGFAAHLDAPAYTHIGDIEHTNIMMAVDAQHTENGCVELVPGSHKIDVTLANGGCIDLAWESGHEFIQIPLNAGDFLIFGSVLAHRSGPNPTEKQRAAVFATYYFKSEGPDLREKYYAHRRLNFPPDHERSDKEEYSEGWKRYAFSAPFTKPEVPLVTLET